MHRVVVKLTMVWIILVRVSLACGQSYTVTDLGGPPGGSLAGQAVNNLGQVVGAYVTSGSSIWHPFIWENGKTKKLGALGFGVYGAYAVGINDSGQVVGWSSTSKGCCDAFLWTKNGGMRDLGIYGVSVSCCIGINNFGDVVGSTGGYAFLWTKTGGLHRLPSVGNASPGAIAVNDFGQIVGFGGCMPLTCGSHAYLWDTSGTVDDLGTLGGDHSYANAINGSGEVVGASNTSSGSDAKVPFLWTSGGGMQNLGVLGGSGVSGVAFGINDTEQVVGEFYYTPFGPNLEAFLWTSSGGMQNLNDLIPADSGWVLYSAYAINNAGQIVGWGTRKGQNHGFLLTPINSHSQ